MTESRRTILQIIPELETGGAELSTAEIAEAIVRAGGRALVLSQGGRLEERIRSCGAEPRFFPAASKNPVQILANARAIERFAREEGVDLIHARSRAPAWSALMAARRLKVPFVTTYHGAYNENGRLKKTYNSVMARGDIVIANSRYTAGLIQSRYGTPAERLRIIYRGVDPARFDPAIISPDQIAKLKGAWNIGPDQKIILQAARLTAWKGHSVVVEAAARLKQAGELGNAVVVLAGDAQGRDGYRQQLLSEIAAAGLEPNFRLPGHVEDMAAALVAAHVTVIASIEPEAFGRTATEAQVIGCPVIATRLGAPPETVRSRPEVSSDQTTGWLVQPGDAAALSTAIGEALRLDPCARQVIGTRARSHVIAGFTLDQMRRQTLAVYDKLLGSHLEAAYERGAHGTS